MVYLILKNILDKIYHHLFCRIINTTKKMMIITIHSCYGKFALVSVVINTEHYYAIIQVFSQSILLSKVLSESIFIDFQIASKQGLVSEYFISKYENHIFEVKFSKISNLADIKDLLISMYKVYFSEFSEDFTRRHMAEAIELEIAAMQKLKDRLATIRTFGCSIANCSIKEREEVALATKLRSELESTVAIKLQFELDARRLCLA